MDRSFVLDKEKSARLSILKELAAEFNGCLNDEMLQQHLEAWGHTKTIEWVRNQMRILEDLGAVAIVDTGGRLTARLVRAGENHLLRRTQIEGIKVPAREA